jgi:hypothetical protein
MKNFGWILVLSFLAIYSIGMYVNRPLSLTDRHLPNEWMDFHREWNDLLSTADKWPYFWFYADELEYAEKAKEVYSEWKHPSEREKMQSIYNLYPALFPEIYEKHKKQILNDGKFDMFSVDNPINAMIDKGIARHMNKAKKREYQERFYALEAAYKKKKNQTDREVFSRLLELRAEYAKGESLPPILSRERRKPDDSDKKEIDSNSPLRRKAIEPLKESEIFKYVPWPTES